MSEEEKERDGEEREESDPRATHGALRGMTEAHLPAAMAASEGREFDVTDWSGHPNYQCRECPFATLDEAEIRAHIATKHSAPTPPRPSGAILDNRGHPITE